MFTAEVNLSQIIDDSEELIDEARAAYDDLEAFAVDEYGKVEAAPDVVYARLQSYEQAKANMEGRINIAERVLQAWGGPTQGEHGEWSGDAFELQMMSGPQAAQVEDRVGAAGVALQQDVGAAPRDMSGERVTEVLAECVVDEPEGIPKQDDDAPTLESYPKPITLWLYEKCNNFNTAGNPNFESTGFGDRTDSPSGDDAATTSSN